jgi:hypothetical protein
VSIAAPQTQAERRLADRDRQWRLYRADKRRQYEELFAVPVHGPLLRKFNSTLGHFGIEDADRMVEYVRERTRAWLRAAPEDIRCAALEMIGHRIVRIRQRAGLAEFDDALPGEEDDVFRLCRKELMP